MVLDLRAVALATFLVAPCAAFADPITVTNPSFESGLSGYYASGSVYARQSDTTLTAHSGSYYAEVLGSAAPVFVSQTLSGLVSGQSYTVSLYESSFANGQAALPLVIQFGDTDQKALPATSLKAWTQVSATFTANAATETFSIIATSGYQIVAIDDVSVSGITASLPEPMSLSLLTAGLVGVALRRRKSHGRG